MLKNLWGRMTRRAHASAEQWHDRNQALIAAFRRGCRNAVPDVAADDEMFMRGHEKAAAIYHYGGRSGLKVCVDALIAANAPLPRRILDFPSGHGRILRYLRAAFPDAALYAGDINQSGLDFCRATFGAETFQSHVDLGKVTLPGKMDLILCASLVTHLSAERARQLINLMCDALAPDGICIFTTHGRMYDRYIHGITPVADEAMWQGVVEGYRATGYGYRPYEAFAHLEYGVSLTSPAWIFQHFEDRDDLTVLSFAEKGWHSQQDVIVVQRRDLKTWYDDLL